jgi:hypothetical protein
MTIEIVMDEKTAEKLTECFVDAVSSFMKEAGTKLDERDLDFMHMASASAVACVIAFSNREMIPPMVFDIAKPLYRLVQLVDVAGLRENKKWDVEDEDPIQVLSQLVGIALAGDVKRMLESATKVAVATGSGAIH